MKEEPRGATRRGADEVMEAFAGRREISTVRPVAPEELDAAPDKGSFDEAAAVAAIRAGTDVALAERNTAGRGS